MKTINIEASLLMVLAFLLLAPSSATAKILFYDDCEDYPSLTEKGGTDWGLTQNAGKLSVSTERKRAGKHSYKLDYTAARGDRVELVLRAPGVNSFEFGKEYWLAWSIFIPNDFAMPTGYGVIGQWHKAGQDKDDNCDQAPRPKNPAVAQPFMIFTSGTDAAPKISVQISGQSKFCQPIPPNRYNYRESFADDQLNALKKGEWNDVVIRTIFRYDSPGLTQMWLNGTKIIDIREINAHNDPLPPMFKLGFYATSTKNHTVYYDEIRIGDANSSYDEVAPSHNHRPPMAPADLQVMEN